MSEPHVPRPAPEYVGKEDVSRHTERALILRIANDVLDLQFAVGRLAGEVGALTKRLLGVEAKAASDADLSGMFRAAAVALQTRVADPHDKLTRDEARGIAEEVVKAARNASDASQLRSIKSRGVDIAIKIVGWTIVTLLAFAAGHYGWK